MRAESRDGSGPLRTGLTTGTSATAAALGAARLALAGERSAAAEVVLPRGQVVSLALAALELVPGGAEAAVIKDAGDDPDATHGAWIRTRVEPQETAGITFVAGPGVGTVTRTGLMLPPGEPAINPVPRQMISDHLERLARELGHPGGFRVTVSVDGGEHIARRTMNPRLGILGGISILGTTGIVRPFSCSAYIASIHQAVDVARANGLTQVACCTGGTSERVARERYGLDEMGLVEMGDFFGAVLKYLRRQPLPRVSLVAGFGKLSKFAAGHPDTHSRSSAIDLDFIAASAEAVGADAALARHIRGCNTSIEALAACEEAGVALGDRIAALALEQARGYRLSDSVLDVVAVDRQGRVVGTAGDEGRA
ncbi:cobalt-precorrin-5B (C(1))-methyltransferase [Thioalkalivibrio sp. ALM2T]|uniref:cobalt-precorrin-5B (C(1))-methyltransferase n=1 Tax=Thioalkalivibrio sp. ALM2T TaxID=1158184 RepID=UPI0003A8403A|nr:cobalt-precorrin-5B (C(1))-methyltransferase [Thioalkalivibrio sp. ALM2T]